MKPIVTKGTNAIFGDNGYAQLPAELYTEKFEETDIECIQTVWELTDDDLKVLNENKMIYVSVVGSKPQPINIDVSPFVGKNE